MVQFMQIPAKDIIVSVEPICLEPVITVFVKVRKVRFHNKTLQVTRKYCDNPFADRNEFPSIGSWLNCLWKIRNGQVLSLEMNLWFITELSRLRPDQ
jgi:hypothetical protein